jgi:hypothetical protein
MEPMEQALEVVAVMLLLALVEKMALSLLAVRTVDWVSDADQRFRWRDADQWCGWRSQTRKAQMVLQIP